MGRLQGVTIDIEGASALEDFEVIEIVDDRNPYLALLGIDSTTYMNGVINLKKQNMIFEKKSFRVGATRSCRRTTLYINRLRL